MAELTKEARSKLIVEIDSGYANEIAEAFFSQGDEDEIITRFYLGGGNTIFRSVENRSTTSTHYFTVEGSNLKLFKAYYPTRETTSYTTT